jgi:Xaa-Pro dipeptidase
MQTVAAIKRAIDADYGDLLGRLFPAFSESEMARRRRLVADMISEKKLDALIVAEAARAGTATGWLTGWPVTAEAVTAVLSDEQPRMFIQHFNHLPLARRIAHDTEVAWGAAGAIEQAVACIAKLAPQAKKLGIVGRMKPSEVQALSSRFDVVDMNAGYTRLRLIKSDEEILWLALAAKFTDLAAAALMEGARPGLNERELSALVQAAYLSYGATNFIHYFQTTAMDDPDTAVPRQFPSGRALAHGDVLTTELSVDYWGYTGQVLRTFFVGREPTELYRELHAVADAVLDKSLSLIRPGVHVRELIAASTLIEEKGFTIIDDFVHGYGGGYLPPILGTTSRPAAGPVPDMVLQAGMTLVVQPNVVTKDWKAGVQTGQLVLVTPTGARSLQEFPRGFHVLPA